MDKEVLAGISFSQSVLSWPEIKIDSLFKNSGLQHQRYWFSPSSGSRTTNALTRDQSDCVCLTLSTHPSVCICTHGDNWVKVCQSLEKVDSNSCVSPLSAECLPLSALLQWSISVNDHDRCLCAYSSIPKCVPNLESSLSSRLTLKLFTSLWSKKDWLNLFLNRPLALAKSSAALLNF